ncbi:MAG: tripartite tricarboxylate transporter substrate-binding protein [Gemmataceae bacterium]
MKRASFGLLLGLSLLAGCQRQDRYPARPIVLICPWSAGGGTDRVSRQIAVQLEERLGVPVNVVNATGGGGVAGHTRGALARPDGYSLTMITPELNMLHWRGMTEVTRRDFDPLMLVNRDEAALFVRADSKWQTLADLTADIRKQPGQLRASGTAYGGIWHLALVGWLEAAGLEATDVNWISINGSNPSLQQLISGGVEMVCCSVPEALSLLTDAKGRDARSPRHIRCLGVMADKRLADLPDVPTFKEQGVDWTVRGWRGLALPPGVPAERKEQLLAALREVVLSDDYRKFLEQSSFGHAAEPSAQFERSLEADDKLYGAMLEREEFRAVHRQRFGPMFFPTILGILLVLATGAWLFTLTRAQMPKTGHDGPAIEAASSSRSGWIQFALAIVWVVLYIAFAEELGFVLTSIALLSFFWSWLGVRWPVALGLAVLLSAGTYQAFAVLLRVPLPWGWLGW